MKTYIKTVFAVSISAILLSSSAYAAEIPAPKIKTINAEQVSGFRKVSVQGNVEVTLVQRSKAGVSYTADNVGSAKVFQKGDLLQISSTSSQPAKLTIYVNDLFRIEGSENAIIRTQGELNAAYLQIFLKQNAKAEIKSHSQGLYTVISDDADLSLSGATDEHTLIMDKTPKLTMNKFAALKTTTSTGVVVAALEKNAKLK